MKRRYLCFVLTLSLLLTLIVSCAQKPDDGDAQISGASADTDAETQSGGFDGSLSAFENAIEIYGRQNYDGREFKILAPAPGSHFYNYSGATENEVWYEEPSNEALPNAIWQRNSKVEETLGIKITPVFMPSTGEIDTTVNTNNAAGDTDAFDVVLNRLDSEMSYAANGYLLNFYDIDSMDMAHRWWDRQIVDTFTFYGNKLYVLSGDINYYDDYGVQIMFFNQKMCRDIGYDFPYDAVRNGTWTMDMMLTMAAAAYSDENASSKSEPGVDILGLGDNYDCIAHYLYPYGLKMSDQNSDGEPEVVWANDINTTVVEKLCDVFTSDYASAATYDNMRYFTEDKLLFYSEMLGMIPNFKDMETDFGILPMPKGSEDMDRYNAYVSNGWSTSYAIPSTFTTDSAYDTGVILEFLSAASMDTVTPALYDQLLQARYIRDPESKEMLSYILDSKVYDLAGDLEWATALRSVYQNIFTNRSQSFVTMMKSVERPVEKSLVKFCTSIQELDSKATGNMKPTDTAGVDTSPTEASYALGDTIEGESYDDKQGSVREEIINDGTDSAGMNLGYVAVGDWVCYNGVDLTGAKEIKARLAGSSGVLEFRIDAPDGTLIASTEPIATGSWNTYDEFTTPITESADGVHTVYIVFTAASTNVDWFMFE